MREDAGGSATTEKRSKMSSPSIAVKFLGACTWGGAEENITECIHMVELFCTELI